MLGTVLNAGGTTVERIDAVPALTELKFSGVDE